MTKESQDDFYVVGIGASAGGLESLEEFFKYMSPEGEAAFVVVQHLSPDHKSHMVQLLSKYASMPVYEAKDGMEVEPDTVYLLSPRKSITISKRKLYLMKYTRDQGSNLPIDIFFESLAKDMGEKAIGIILSGTGSDGTQGVRVIKEMGGMVMAQDKSAKFEGMPQSVISANLVDYICPPREMPTNLLSYINHPDLATKFQLKSPSIRDDDLMSRMFKIVQKVNKVDFSGYKPTTILRRVERRMSINRIDELEEYIEYLERSEIECRTLYKEFLIGVTRFFRDSEPFDFLFQKVFPNIFQSKDRYDQVRIWVPGCSTGEEAYSLAILCQEYMEKTGQHLEIKIFATDIDREALDFASQGIYPPSILGDLSVDRLQKFFVKRGTRYEILRQIRTMVVFAYQNVCKDPPFSKMDLVSCRNLLIYLRTDLQRKVLEIFQFAINPGGYLFLGSSESIGEALSTFSIEHHKWKIYRQHTELSSSFPIRTSISLSDEKEKSPVKVRDYRPPEKRNWENRGGNQLFLSLIEQVLPPCVVVDESYNVLHAFGEVRQYLEVPLGYQIELNILKMAQEELVLPLSTALYRTIQEQEEVIYRNINLGKEESKKQIHLITRPFWEKQSQKRLVLIIFEPVQPSETVESSDQEGQQYNIEKNTHQRMLNLEQELQYTKENLQATIEELETANEELQATNEELLAANEELQSTNEELHSVNEELMTVNTEYQAKIRELGALNDDMNNLLKSVEVGIIFLDADLRLRRFTPMSQNAINLMEQDIGRPFEHITNSLVNINLLDLVEQVRESLEPFTQEIQDKRGYWYHLKIRPYQTRLEHIDGVMVALIDITDLKETEISLRESEKRYRITAANIPDGALFLFDEEMRYLLADGKEIRRVGLQPEYFEGKQVRDIYQGEQADNLEKWYGQVLAGQKVQVEYDHPDGHSYILSMVPIRNVDGEVYAGIVLSQNVTKRKQAEVAKRWEAKLNKLLLRSMPLFFVALSPTGEILRMNNTMLKATSYREKEVIEKNYLSIFVPPEEHSIIHQAIEKHLSKGHKGKVVARNHILTKEGKKIWVEWYSNQLLNPEGELDHFIALGRDISSEKD